MHDATRLAGAFFLHESQRVLGRGACMDHEGLATLARGADVRAESFPLPVRVPFDTKIVQARLADADDLFIVRQGEQFIQ